MNRQCNSSAATRKLGTKEVARHLGMTTKARERWDRRLTARGNAPGVLIVDDPQKQAEAVAATSEALAEGAEVIHEAAFTYGGVKAKVEVSVVRLVHLNNSYEWRGGEYDLEQLFTDEDVTGPATALQESVPVDIPRLLRMLGSDEAPTVPESTSCSKPYGCPYLPILDFRWAGPAPTSFCGGVQWHSRTKRASYRRYRWGPSGPVGLSRTWISRDTCLSSLSAVRPATRSGDR